MFAGQVGLDGGQLLAQAARAGARGAQRGHDADFRQQRGDAHDQVLLAVDHGPLAEHVLVRIDVAVDQPPALFLRERRDGRGR